MKKAAKLPQFPYVYTIARMRVFGVCLLLLMLPLFGLMVNMLSRERHAEIVNTERMIFAGVVGFMSLGFLGLALLLIRARRTIRATPNEVTCHEVSLFGKTTHWTEPLASYRSVLRETIIRLGSPDKDGHQQEYTEYRVTLCHPMARKNLLLYTSRTPKGQRACWEQWARLLHLPAVERIENGLITRPPEELDLSIRELVRRGVLAVDFVPHQTPPDGVTANDEGSEYVVTILKAPHSPINAFILMVVLLPFMMFSYEALEKPVLGMGIGAGYLLYVGWMFLTHRQLRLSSEQVCFARQTPFGILRGRRVKTAEIEQVEVTYDSVYGRTVTICTDARETRVGKRLSPETLAWLKNCIIAKISQ